MEKGKNIDNEKKIGPVKFFAWNLRGVSTGVCLMVMGYLSIYCTNTLGLNIAVVSMLLVVSKVIDAFTDLIAGLLVDKTNTKIGRGRPYELSIIGLWVCTYLLFSVPESWSMTVKYIWVLLMYIFVNAVFFTLLNANVTAYTVRAFKYHEQYVKLSTLGFVVPMVGVAVFNVIFPTLVGRIATSQAGWSRLIGITAIFMTALGLLRFIFVPETNKEITEAEQEKEKVTLKDVGILFKNDKYIFALALVQLVLNFTTNLGVTTYYFTYIVGDISKQSILALVSLVSLPLAFVIPQLLKKTSVVKVIILGNILSITAGVINFIAGSNVVLLSIAGFLGGIGTVPCSMLPMLLIIDCADYNEYIGIQRMEGTLSAVNGFAGKVGAAAATAVTGLLLAAAGFVSSTQGAATMQPGSALWMIRALYSIVPAVLWVITALTMMSYKLEKKMPEIRSTLEERRAQAKSQEV
ncbi:MAG: MFS transporter [Lachnospiraceae bacterium]|nr:MFS transporter [Lachnospiraceae bacterium]